MREATTAKQLKKVQEKKESQLKAGDFVKAYWTYSDYLENQKHFSGIAEVSDIERDSFLVRITEDIKDPHGIILYPKHFLIYIPKTTSPIWGMYSRLEVIKN